MKLYRFLIVTLALTTIAVSCRDAEPNIPFNVFNHGAYARTTNIASGAYNFFDLANSAFTATIQIVDERDGDLLQSVDIYVAHRRGQTVTSEGLLKTLQAAAFTRQPATNQPGTATTTGRTDGKPDRSYPTTTFSVTGTEASSVAGPALAAILPGDAYEIRLVLNLTDGRSFTNTNSSADIQGGPFYASPFFYRATVVCPSDLGGTINYVATNSVAGAGAPGTGVPAAVCNGSGTVTWTGVAGTPGTYTMSDASFGVFACLGYGAATGVRLTDACATLNFVGPDQFGDTYDINLVSNDGTTLVLDWENTWGDGGRAALTRTGGWPLNLNTN
ncbi:MAG TPA: hypothetical protein PKC24_15225 [Cyclobacteriaceae bacterium]|nr:hypothetical protein [Cyclobacteriaceae bacterium]